MRPHTAHAHRALPGARIVAGLTLALALGAAGMAGLRAAPAATTGSQCGATATGTRVGSCAATFALPDVHGRIVALARYRGHPVLLNFWGIGCPYCALELPDLQTFARTFRHRGGVILGVDVWGESSDVVAIYAHGNRVTWPLLVDPPTRVGNLYGVRGTPTNVFVDRRGVIRAIMAGPLTLADFHRLSMGL